jgi:hypothetical protein
MSKLPLKDVAKDWPRELMEVEPVVRRAGTASFTLMFPKRSIEKIEGGWHLGF